MRTSNERLIHCFATVFPDAQAIPDLTPDTEPRWDSTTHIVLIQVIEDEFEVSIPESAAGELLSFQSVEEYLSARVPTQ